MCLCVCLYHAPYSPQRASVRAPAPLPLPHASSLLAHLNLQLTQTRQIRRTRAQGTDGGGVRCAWANATGSPALSSPHSLPRAPTFSTAAPRAKGKGANEIEGKGSQGAERKGHRMHTTATQPRAHQSIQGPECPEGNRATEQRRARSSAARIVSRVIPAVEDAMTGYLIPHLHQPLTRSVEEPIVHEEERNVTTPSVRPSFRSACLTAMYPSLHTESSPHRIHVRYTPAHAHPSDPACGSGGRRAR